MKKLGSGYANYFNLKNRRVGSLFQGRFKAVLINQEEHFRYLPIYIHLNPLDLVRPEWREGKIKNYSEAIEFLKSYRWSSYLDYIGQPNFPNLIKPHFLLDILDLKDLKADTEDFMKALNLESIKDLALESI